jgi:hypothetical protein
MKILKVIILLLLLLNVNTFKRYYNKLSLLANLKLKSIDWLEVISRSNDIIINIKKLKDIKIDFTAGASSISLPSNDRIIESYNEIMIFGNTSTIQQPPILVVHQLGKKVVRKLPSAALLGALVLISSELLQREINTKSYQLPPLLQEIANSTVFELDTKLEYLSALKWDLDPFLAAEMENLQTQPLEVIDRYIVKELLPRVDKELSPVLSNLITDPAKVKQITANIKDLLNLGSSLLLTEQASRNQNDINTKINKYTNKILEQVFEQVDVVGQYMEDSVKDWNKIINLMNQMVKTDSVLNLFPNSSTLSSFTSLKTYQLPTTTIDKDDDDRKKQ